LRLRAAITRVLTDPHVLIEPVGNERSTRADAEVVPAAIEVLVEPYAHVAVIHPLILRVGEAAVALPVVAGISSVSASGHGGGIKSNIIDG
jgi:hypothetical protein